MGKQGSCLFQVLQEAHIVHVGFAATFSTSWQPLESL